MLRYQERHRNARRAEFLAVARGVLETDGPEALTMQRITDALGSSTGGIYIYFRTKDDLLWTLACDAWGTLARSYEHGQLELDAALADRTPATVAGLARILATGAFWADAEEQLPTDLALARRLLEPSGRGEHGPEVLEATHPLLAAAQQRIESAATAGAIGAADGAERALLLFVIVNASLRSGLTTTADRRGLASRMLHDVLVGWGADRSELAGAEIVLSAFRQVARLAPPVEDAA